MSRILSWFKKLYSKDERTKLEGEIEEEFRFHIDMKAASLVSQGMDPEEAKALASSRFGDTKTLRRAALKDLSSTRRRENRAHRIGGVGRDLSTGIRQLAKRPGFALLAAGTLALGLSASTAVFTYVNAYRQPFPGADADELYQVFMSTENVPFGPLSYPDYLDLAAEGQGLFTVAGSVLPLFAASVRHETLTEVVFGEAVTGNFFRMAGVTMSLGRAISVDDDRAGAPPTVVISHRYWARRYGMARDVVGRTILLNNRPHTIIGVAGRDFVGSVSARRPEIWLPFEPFKQVYWARSDRETNREVGSVVPYVRLSDGSAGQAQERLAVVAGRLDREEPLLERSRRFRLDPATWIHPSIRQSEAQTTRIMLIAVACLLLLACANVANLVLSAGTKRRQEMAIRTAMGASRWRLVRQLLAEAVLLSGLAAVLALVLAGPAGSRLSSYFARPSVWGSNVPREIDIDPMVLGFALLAAVLTGVVSGLIPALRASSRDLLPALKAGGRWGSDGASGPRLKVLGTRDLLVSVQIGLAVVLLFLASLLLRTLDSARRVDPGFDTDWTLASYISTSSMGTPVAERVAFFRDLAQRFETMPWVQAATVAEQAPLSGHPSQELRMDGSEEPLRTIIARVMPGYFEAMEMEIVRGRPLSVTDTVEAFGVVLVNETLAGRMGRDTEALGSLLWWPGADGGEDRAYEVVGVVRDARQTMLLGEPEPVAYFSLPQHYSAPGNAFLLKVAGNPAAAVQRMEDELHAVDPRIAIVNILPYSQVVEGFLYSQRMNAELFSVIAVVGLILSAAGVFGVVSLAVARRRKEIGIRLAIGAQKGAIARLVTSRVAVSVAIGLAAGLAAALLATRLVESLLWGISPTDPWSMGVGVTVLLASVTLAVILPIRRALAVDPVGSLQAD